MSALRVFVLIIAMFSAASPCLAQTEAGQSESSREGSEPRQERKQYIVEVITFRYLGPDSAGGEEFDQLFVEDFLPTGTFDSDEYNRVRKMVTYTGMVHLRDVLERLRMDQRYALMSNAAWVQPLLNKNEAVDVPLGDDSGIGASSAAVSPASGSPRVSGSVRVYGGHLLFVDLDLKVVLPTRPGNTRKVNSQDAGSDEPAYISEIGGSSVSESPPDSRFKTFRLSERRRIKLEEFHYFDHPYFGAIVSVARH